MVNKLSAEFQSKYVTLNHLNNDIEASVVNSFASYATSLYPSSRDAETQNKEEIMSINKNKIHNLDVPINSNITNLKTFHNIKTPMNRSKPTYINEKYQDKSRLSDYKSK